MLGLTVDPGMENGLCLFSWTDTTPMKIESLWQFPGGAPGLHRALSRKLYPQLPVKGEQGHMMFGYMRLDALVVEKFTPRPHETFSLTQKAVEPLRGEGVLLGMGLNEFIQWAEPSQQYFIGDSRLPLEQKKKLARAFLKKHGLLPAPKDVGRPDANDAVSATLHTIAFMRRMRHMPTLQALFPETY